ncbi:MAG TPA: ROK family protein [Methylomirabilota bacterium]
MTSRSAPAKRRSDVFIGVDVGATSLSGGLVTGDGEVLQVLERRTREDGAGTTLDRILAVIAALLAEARGRGISVAGVGIGLPGIVDVDKGMMPADVYLVPDLEKVPIAERIREATGLPVFLDNDVNALALAEHRFGAGRGVASLAVLALGTGPGGALVLNGELVRGRNGYAGEFGHMPVLLDGPPCVCGGHGCLAVFVSHPAMSRRARLAATEHPESGLCALAGGDPSAITPRIIFAAAADGDPVATALVDRACEALGAALGIILNGFNPDVVVVTGGMAAALVPLERDILRRTARYAFDRVLADTTIRIVPSSKRETVRGGAALVMYESERRERALRRATSKPARKRG